MPFHYMTDVNCVEAIQQWAQHWPLWYTVLQQMSGWEFTPYASWYVRSDRKELIHCSEVLFMPKVTRSRCRSRSWSTQSNSQLLFIACSHFRYNFCCRKILHARVHLFAQTFIYIANDAEHSHEWPPRIFAFTLLWTHRPKPQTFARIIRSKRSHHCETAINLQVYLRLCTVHCKQLRSRFNILSGRSQVAENVANLWFCMVRISALSSIQCFDTVVGDVWTVEPAAVVQQVLICRSWHNVK